MWHWKQLRVKGIGKQTVRIRQLVLFTLVKNVLCIEHGVLSARILGEMPTSERNRNYVRFALNDDVGFAVGNVDIIGNFITGKVAGHFVVRHSDTGSAG